MFTLILDVVVIAILLDSLSSGARVRGQSLARWNIVGGLAYLLPAQISRPLLEFAAPISNEVYLFVVYTVGGCVIGITGYIFTRRYYLERIAG